jgi:hypothetical protein
MNMKKYFVVAFMALLAGFALTFQSCKGDPDPCEEVVCQNAGTCNEGNCDCPEYYFGEVCEDKCVSGTYANGVCDCKSGYEGTTCETQMREKYLGSWTVYEECFNPPSEYPEYTMQIDISTDGVLNFGIDNFQGEASTPIVLCLVDKDNSSQFVIEEQDYGENGQKIEGSGAFNSTGDTITIDYKVTFSNGADICRMKLY